MSTIAPPPTHAPLRHVLRYVNLAIAAVLLAALVAVYWFAYRVLPQTSGVIPAPVAHRVTIARDALGVPHISAASEDDLYFAQGYATAQDRLWQMDGLRRLAGGDLSEIIGPAGLELDRDARRLRMRRIAEQAYVSLPAKDRAPLAAYARGVNYFIQTHLHRLPIEFTLLGYQPRPWSVIDSILVGLDMYRDLTTSWKSEILKRDMLVRGERAKVDFLFPPRSGAELQPGSNAWAISGAHTATGKPLLANDMHLEYSIPGIWYMVHLQAPGLDVAGVSLPGAPAVIVGHNRRIAWGVTNLQFDVQDLYIENIDLRTGRYLYRGQWEQARAEREVIVVKGQRPIEMPLWVTRHGPLFLSDGHQNLSLRWTAAEPGAFQFPFPEINKARNWQEFTAALSRFAGPAQNFVYADVDGNIGYHAAGLLPIRKGYTGDVPVDGSSGDYEWQGFIPFDQLPAFYNPPSGLIVTANQNPFPADYPYTVNGEFASHYRSRQIRDLLAARNGWRAADMLTVQKDVYSGCLHYLARALTAAYDQAPGRHRDLAGAVGLLRAWNGQMDKNEAAPLVAVLAYRHLREMAALRASPDGAKYKYEMAPAVIEKLVRTRPPGWFPDWDEAILRCLSEGLQEGRRTQGRDPAHWVYGKFTGLLLANPVGSHLPLVAGLFDIGPVAMSGSSTTVKQLTDHLGPSMRMDADLSDWDHSLLEGTTGQSGQVLSRHYKDEWDSYYYARSFPMQFGKVESKAVLTLEPEPPATP
jgi:penicillin G amidase